MSRDVARLTHKPWVFVAVVVILVATGFAIRLAMTSSHTFLVVYLACVGVFLAASYLRPRRR